ncbi:MAG: FAD-dependent oxidoreductase [Gammaproteobacteria bacterium]|jgi:3-phenylpropionate/trans-cinnamate dioxygenase ferredoxin reductase subunit|nr:FAD-dependent oxidoreductase [Gammaproteobacteria bacterium]
MSEQTCIVVGASHAGTTLALQLRREGWEGKILLISEEDELPYHRPPLSKELLAGKKTLDEIRLRPAKLFTDNDVELMLSTRVEKLDRDAKIVLLSDGSSRQYDKLAICTGATVRTLPGSEKFDNVFTIRNAADIEKFRPLATPDRKVVIVGGGYIGLEAAAVLCSMGLEVTVIEAAKRVLERVTSEVMSAYMTQLHTSRGVTIVANTMVSELRGHGSVESVVCADGSEYEADFVIAGIGVIPNVGLCEEAGLATDRGVLVDENAQTTDANIYAAGDCARHPSALYRRPLLLESVQNATDQSRVAAANICGKVIAYDAVPWFWSDQYEIKLQMVGLSDGFDELAIRGTPEVGSENGFALFYLKDGVVIAADCVGRPKEFMLAKKLVKDRAAVTALRLADESVEVAALIAV